jgi:hypothetical protein
MLTPCQFVGHVHEDRGDGSDTGRVAGRDDVPGGPERDRKNLGGSDEPPRDGLRNRLAHWDAHWPESGRPLRVVRCAEFRRGPWSYAKLAGPSSSGSAHPLNCADHPNR